MYVRVPCKTSMGDEPFQTRRLAARKDYPLKAGPAGPGKIMDECIAHRRNLNNKLSPE